MICVDNYDNGVPMGRFYNPASPDGVPFQSLIQMLVKMEDLLDGMSFPQAFTVARTFSRQELESEERDVSGGTERKGRLATFAVRILFRQNASWQGSVSWLEGEREESFRSVLELILLMDSAMQG